MIAPAFFVYSVWLRDLTLPPADQDHEWVACLVVSAFAAEDAQAWGDHLATNYCARMPDTEFISSSVEAADMSDPGVQALPFVADGHHASDQEIGW